MAAAAAGWVGVERRPGGYAVVTLRREPVNTMNLALWRRLSEVLDELEADPQVLWLWGQGWGGGMGRLGGPAPLLPPAGLETKARLSPPPQVRGVIFCSGLRRDVFTAGNDIRELYAPLTSAERYRCGARPRPPPAACRLPPILASRLAASLRSLLPVAAAWTAWYKGGSCAPPEAAPAHPACTRPLPQRVLGGVQPLPGPPLRLAAGHPGRHPRCVASQSDV